MHPTEFPEQNCVFAKDQPEYLPLPALRPSVTQPFIVQDGQDGHEN